MTSKPTLQIETEPEVESEIHGGGSDTELPIALRKGTRECTKRPLYLLAHFLSFKQFSPSHKAFLNNLETIAIPSNLFEACLVKNGNNL
jgi:hypothetical protein